MEDGQQDSALTRQDGTALRPPPIMSPGGQQERISNILRTQYQRWASRAADDHEPHPDDRQIGSVDEQRMVNNAKAAHLMLTIEDVEENPSRPVDALRRGRERAVKHLVGDIRLATPSGLYAEALKSLRRRALADLIAWFDDLVREERRDPNRQAGESEPVLKWDT